MSFKISAVTATYNRKDFLPQCIMSVAGQPYPYKEHVLIDGGSTDGTVGIIKAYAAKYPHIKWISEKDNGVSSALNKGLALANGDAVGVIGDDDFYVPNVFGIIAAEFERDESVGIVAGNCDFLRNNGSLWKRQKASFTSRKDLIQCWRYWGNSVTLPAPSTFIRKKVIDVVGGFDENDRYAMDYHHWIKITEKFEVTTVDEVFAKFRYDEGSISFSLAQAQWAEVLAISKKYWGTKRSLAYYEMLFSYLQYYKRARFEAQAREKLLSSPMTRRIVRDLLSRRRRWGNQA